MQRTMYKQRGFTLTEMAIVVVLGGILLAAGLMAGRGQISRSQAQDVIQIVGDLQTASASFKQRYGYLPGDWIRVANIIPNTTAANSPGNGDGLIGVAGDFSAATGLATPNTEVTAAMLQLYQSGLIGKLGTTATQYVQSQFGPVQIGVAAGNATAAYTAANASVKNVIVFFNLPCEVVLDVDRALDDGVGTTGKVRTDVACTAGGTAVRTFVPL